jgi:argininosuccinate synthase
MEIVRKEKADAISHGATGKGNDQVRFECTAYSMDPNIKIIVPWREEKFRKQFPGRAEMIAYCNKKGIPVQATAKKPYSSDRNLLHISFESGILEDPWLEPSKDMFKLSVAPEDAPDKAEYVTLDFERGICVAVNGKGLSPANVLRTLNKLGGKHGVGRVDLVENRVVGMKSRGVYETPGGAILHWGHRQMETLTMDREVMHLRDSLIPRYSELVYYGFWFSPERLALQALVTESQKNVTGTVRLKLYKGNIMTVGRKSALSLYRPDIVTMESGESIYDQSDATGFIKLNALRLRVEAMVEKEAKKGAKPSDKKGGKKK